MTEKSSLLEMLFAVGNVLGPSLGAFLDNIGGFLFCFAGVGGFLCLAVVLAVAILPQLGEESTMKKNNFLHLLSFPTIVLYSFVAVASSFTVTFLQPILEPHLKQFALPTSVVALLFPINSGVYALTAGMWGFLSDKYINPKLICGVGSLFIVIAFLLIGPAVFIPLKPSPWLMILALVLHGIGGAEYIAAFLVCNQEVLKRGFPNNTETYGIVSSIWQSGSCLGSFLGPSLAGILYSSIGFRNACLINVALHAFVGTFTFTYYTYEKRKAQIGYTVAPG